MFLSAFSSWDQCLRQRVQARNQALAFPLELCTEPERFYQALGRQSLLVSGGRDQDRAAVLLGTACSAPAGLPTVILHNGNPYLMPQALSALPQLETRVWSYDPLIGCSRGQQLARLAAGSREELAVFWAFALDVCQALGLPEQLTSLADIQWTATQWQHQVIQTCPPDLAADLLGRFDRSMAGLAAQASLFLARMCPPGVGGGILPLCNLAEGLEQDRVLTIPLLGGAGDPMLKQCLSVLTEAMSRGTAFQLLLDNVPVPAHHPLVYSPAAQVQLVLAADDLCALAGAPAELTCRGCGAVLFRHGAETSAKRLSLHFFGEYDRMFLDQTAGRGQQAAHPMDHSAQQSLSTRSAKDLRLPARSIQQLPMGAACVRLPRRSLEGIFLFAPPDSNQGPLFPRKKALSSRL